MTPFARAAAVWTAAAALAGGIAFGQEPAAAADARQYVEAQQKVISRTMHPTSKLVAARYDGVETRRDGFAVTYTYRYTHFIQGEFYSRMEFAFNARGKFVALTPRDSSAVVPPFVGSTLGLKLVSEAIADELDLKDNALVKAAIDAADAQTALQLYLTYKHAAPPAPAAGGNAELIGLINKCESMSAEERRMWIADLPRMTAAQRAELRRIVITERDDLKRIDDKYRGEFAAIGRREELAKNGYDLLRGGDHKGSVRVLTDAIAESPKAADLYYLRGQAHQAANDHKAAVADFTVVADRNPKLSAAYCKRAYSYNRLGDHRKAYLDYSRATDLAPTDPQACNGRAWLLATCPDAKYRDGREAVEYGTKACELTGWKDAFYFDTLAAAYAENGQFAKAVEWQTKAVADPEFEKRAGKEETAAARRRLGLYHQNKAFQDR